MNSVHDMGGMHGMGPIRYEKDEPVFHARWEGRVYALAVATGACGKWNLDAVRHQRELIPGPEYLRMSYYEKWLTASVELLLKHQLVTRAEIQSGRRARGAAKAAPPLSADKVLPFLAKGRLARRDVAMASRFQTGQRVRTRNIHPEGHTRLPRYARGKLGTVERDHGVFVFPDSNAHFLGENPQHVYLVRFSARELWGEQAKPHDSVYIDLWEDYLEPA